MIQYIIHKILLLTDSHNKYINIIIEIVTNNVLIITFTRNSVKIYYIY